MTVSNLHSDDSTAEGLPRQPIIFAVFASVAAVILFLKSPESSAAFVSFFGKILQFAEFGLHLEAALLRVHAELFQNLSSQMVVKGEMIHVELKPRSIPLGLKVRTFFLVAATDITVIIPTWNEEKYLQRCLSSIVNQSCKQSFEIVVIDGGSSDTTVEIARKHADKVIVRQGQRVGASRNLGAKAARGNVLAFIDADTIATADWLEEIARSFEEHSLAAGVTGPTLPYGGNVLDEVVYRVATGSAQRLSLKLGFPHVAGFNCAYRKHAFWEAGGFEEGRELSEDIMLSLRIRHQGPIIFNPDMMAYTSLRRIKKYGYPYLTTYYAINAAMMLLFKRTMVYPKIR